MNNKKYKKWLETLSLNDLNAVYEEYVTKINLIRKIILEKENEPITIDDNGIKIIVEFNKKK